MCRYTDTMRVVLDQLERQRDVRLYIAYLLAQVAFGCSGLTSGSDQENDDVQRWTIGSMLVHRILLDVGSIVLRQIDITVRQLVLQVHP